MPTPLEALACGSRSTKSVGRSAAARLAARFTAVVVFPTPPFWLAIAMTLLIHALFGTRRIPSFLERRQTDSTRAPLPGKPGAPPRRGGGGDRLFLIERPRESF